MGSQTTRVSEGVYLLDTLALGQPGTVAAYVVKGEKVALIDCGYASSYESVLTGLSELGISPSAVSYIIPTHVHLDHAGASGELSKRMPRAKILAHPKAVEHLADPTKLIKSATRLFGETIMAAYGLPIPVPIERISAVADGESLDLGAGVRATFLDAPGHAPHQVAVNLEHERLLITADSVGIAYPDMKVVIPTTPPPSLEPEKLLDTVDRARGLSSKALLVPHFGVRSDVDRIFEETKRKVPLWIGEVAELRRDGKAFDEIVDVMTKKVELDESGPLPIYAELSVRVSVSGIVTYLDHK
jgi:glyoxylase-like metal-dependent hydrolase (beta-lactamase superfamily II)